jgi:ankyrin repeat protein
MHVAKSAEVVDLLISKGLRVDEPDRNGDQPLHHAAKNANGQLMAHLLAKGAKANAGNAAGRTPLMLLRGYRDKEASTDLLDLLIEQGADLRPRDKNGYGAVDVAAEQRDLKILKHLLKKGARAAAADPGGYTALHRAQSREVAEALIEAGASPKSSALDGKTPLHRAANGHGDVVDLLLGHAVDVNAVDKAGQTPIFSAAGHESIAKKLIEAGATVNVTDHEGKTPIHYAASRNIGVVKLLLEKGARVDVKDKLGNTPLHEAARLHNDYFAKSLIELGADPQARNGAGKTPADVAEDAARTRVQQSFSQSPAKK